jgi:5'(3')-deoxyribonucleotidase
MNSSEPIALFDMDNSLADFEASMNEKLLAIRSPFEPETFPPEHEYPDKDPDWLKARKNLIKRQPGFWRGLPTIQFGIDLYNFFGHLGYRRMILTKGPRGNAPVWTEKVEWCQAHIPDADITITHDKGIVYGKVLYDDFPPYIKRWLEWRPRGKVFMLDAPHNRDFHHPNILRCYRHSLDEQKEAILTHLAK